MSKIAVIAAVCIAVGFIAWMGCYHIVWKPTPDQLYGCSVAQQAHNGECK